MNENIELTSQQIFQTARWQTRVMSIICGLLCFLAAVAATRIPLYVAISDFVRLIGVFLFVLLALIGLVNNVRTHICLWRLQNLAVQGA